MIRHFKNHFFVLLFFTLAACSSNTNVGQDDLSISEIEDIEKTGEFSEEDFFKDEEILKESGVGKLDIEGLDDSNLKSDDDNLVSDLDVQDFEGQGFDKEDDFETDLDSSNNVAEFDEFDEFVTNEKVAKNEDIIKNEAPQISDIADQPTMTEEDIFSEFEESTDVAAGNDQVDTLLGDDSFQIKEEAVVADQTGQPELNFEDVFDESQTSTETKIADSDVMVDTSIDDSLGASDYQNDFVDVGGPIAEESSDYDEDFGPGPAPSIGDDDIPAPRSDYLQAENRTETRTAKELLANQYEKPRQIVRRIVKKVKSWIPVKKMKDDPYLQNGILLNALYIVREGDTFDKIGEKIYGKGSFNNLAKVNPFLRKKLRVGEKVYYNSPNRPNDDSRMLFHYDDVGQVPQFRQVGYGENIRKISMELLGHPRSWMEIWATNPELVSKGVVDRDYKIKYFSKNNVQSMVQETPALEVEVPDETQDETFGATDPGTNENQDTISNELPDFEEPNVEDSSTGDALAGTGEPDLDAGFDDPVLSQNEEPNLDEPNFDQGFDQSGRVADNGLSNIPNELNQQVQETGGLKKLYFGMDQKMIETVAMGLGGLLLIIVILLIARRRRMYAQATQVQEFDFAGSTQIDEQTKTHIDI